jgi:hypothetical protein
MPAGDLKKSVHPLTRGCTLFSFLNKKQFQQYYQSEEPMTLSRRLHSVFAVACAFAASQALAADPTTDSASKPIRVVACDAHVQSHKRGVCANHLDDGDFRALAPGVSWWYNWHFKPSTTPPADAKIEFLPMAWGDTPERLQGLDDYLAAGNKPRAVLAINEPNLRGQAFIPPQQTAELYKKIKAIADKYHLPTVGPQMALGSPTGDSISADDPVQNKHVTYTFMVPFLEATQFYMKPEAFNQVAFHSYGNIYEMRHFVDTMGKQFGPVWVTEYAQWHTKNQAEALKYLVQSTDYLERSPSVVGYAWFKERVKDNPRISLLSQQSGELTVYGKAYVALPVHDGDLYYRLPGKLPAANYVELADAEINPANEPDGFVQMTAEKPNATLTYNVVAESAGQYTVRIHAEKTGKITLDTGGTVAEASAGEKGWQTIETKLTLVAGAQKVNVSCNTKGQSIAWIEFVR